MWYILRVYIVWNLEREILVIKITAMKQISNFKNVGILCLTLSFVSVWMLVILCNHLPQQIKSSCAHNLLLLLISGCDLQILALLRWGSRIVHRKRLGTWQHRLPIQSPQRPCGPFRWGLLSPKYVYLPVLLPCLSTVLNKDCLPQSLFPFVRFLYCLLR